MPFCMKGGKAFGNEDRMSAGHFNRPIGSKVAPAPFARHGSGKVKPAPKVLKSKGAGGR
jgi:hypothetical protein